MRAMIVTCMIVMSLVALVYRAYAYDAGTSLRTGHSEEVAHEN